MSDFLSILSKKPNPQQSSKVNISLAPLGKPAVVKSSSQTGVQLPNIAIVDLTQKGEREYEGAPTQFQNIGKRFRERKIAQNKAAPEASTFSVPSMAMATSSGVGVSGVSGVDTEKPKPIIKRRKIFLII